ncbi:class II aldolase [Phyllobacterium salinisoli]|uniref:Class II aldolase n=1 Tax=Phyllobacterium salinisoli TaxID=1899321 RepID=A0A368JZE4_9HYPH|nr:class II aldolase/adducin family protein [Phyllobacterium salinisoli]RCS21795.1 class II aldolase [Phyllobacterium salinisoli]
MPSEISRPEVFARFLDLSRKIGGDILKTQGAGGNTSLKQDGVMWVKASGMWLSEARARDIMVPVEVAPLVAALRQGDPRAETATDFVIADLNTSGLRPSIETSFHAALRAPVVAHYHCVNTIAHAVLEDRDTRLNERMATLPDLTFATIPYRRPGVPLAREIERMADRQPDVLVLYNHGVIVCGMTTEEVADRIERVTAVLAIQPRQSSLPDTDFLVDLSKDSGFRPASDPVSHRTALDPASLKVATGGSLYPDHVIFLGTKIGIVPDGQSIADVLGDYAQRNEPLPKMLIVPGKGVLLSETLTPGGAVMARCLADVVTRVPADARIAYITEAGEYELIHWEAEQYRQALDRKSAER